MQFVDPPWHVLDLDRLDASRRLIQQTQAFLHELEGRFGRHGFDPPYPGADPTFRNDLEETKFVGVLDVVPTTEFGVEVADLYDPDLVAVLVGKEGDRPHLLGRFDVGFDRRNRNFLPDLFVDHHFNLL